MNPETDAQLIERVLDQDLVRDDNEFITNEEVAAYAHHLDERDLVDTEANRATWVAARTYYDAETSNEHVVELGGEFFTQAQWDVMNRWRDGTSSPTEGYEGGDDDKPETADSMISASDLGLRREALAFAVQSVGGHETLDRAKTYLSFLQGE